MENLPNHQTLAFWGKIPGDLSELASCSRQQKELASIEPHILLNSKRKQPQIKLKAVAIKVSIKMSFLPSNVSYRASVLARDVAYFQAIISFKKAIMLKMLPSQRQ